MGVNVVKDLNIFLNRLVKSKFPINEINVYSRDIGNGNFDYTVWVHPTWEGHSRLQSDENFEKELFDYIEKISKDGFILFRESPGHGHYFNKVDWFWD